MRFARTVAFASVVAAGTLALGGPGEPGAEVRFAAPVRIRAGEALAGAGRYFPSPVLHDMNGDGRPDLVIGDLMGSVTVALRTDAGFAAEQPVLDRDGRPLKFHNW